MMGWLRRLFCTHRDPKCGRPPFATIDTAEGHSRHIGASRTEFPHRDVTLRTAEGAPVSEAQVRRNRNGT